MATRRRLAYRKLAEHWEDPYWAANKVPCPTCLAAVRVECRRGEGRIGPHTTRMEAAAAKGEALV